MTIEEQEKRDFERTEVVMRTIFKAYGKEARMERTPQYSAYDARMTVGQRKYTVEIKERNVDCIEELTELPLKVKKYCSVMESTADDETPLVVYLVNDEQYYIFRLDRLDLNKVGLRNWNIPKVQFASSRRYEPQPTFFIPLGMAAYNGFIPKGCQQ